MTPAFNTKLIGCPRRHGTPGPAVTATSSSGCPAGFLNRLSLFWCARGFGHGLRSGADVPRVTHGAGIACRFPFPFMIRDLFCFLGSSVLAHPPPPIQSSLAGSVRRLPVAVFLRVLFRGDCI